MPLEGVLLRRVDGLDGVGRDRVRGLLFPVHQSGDPGAQVQVRDLPSGEQLLHDPVHMQLRLGLQIDLSVRANTRLPERQRRRDLDSLVVRGRPSAIIRGQCRSGCHGVGK